MAWSLEIHHLDIGQGDSTLFIARNDGVGANQSVQVRSVLIDGGRLQERNDLHNYLSMPLPHGINLNRLDVMVSTHYDGDHLNGLTGLLNLNSNLYDNTIIFDQGNQSDVRARRKRGGAPSITIDGEEQIYLQYKNAISKRGARQRVTEKVYPPSTKSTDRTVLDQAGWHGPNWLVGREIMWTDGTGAPVTPGSLLNPAAPNDNQNPPTITCIAANQFIKDAGNNRIMSGIGPDLKNEMSLAFLVKFNKFKYYIGGDIETTQEDYIQDILNPDDDGAGRVLAVKVSHHGSDRSTSDAFLSRLRPQVAFISCGYGNQFGQDGNGPIRLPRVRVLNSLENCATLERYYLTEDREQNTFDARVGMINAGPPYVPANNTAGNIANAYTAKAVVAGGWGEAPFTYPQPIPASRHGDIAPGRRLGHVILKVSEAESKRAINGPLGQGQYRFRVSCYTADATQEGLVTHNY
jgi:beta-lactamase superfamily II metal-dependent hydrolase